jgi:hypothetical protein
MRKGFAAEGRRVTEVIEKKEKGQDQERKKGKK